MTKPEFLEVKAWMVDRWPAMESFRSGQWLAYFDDLERFDTSDVWSALYSYCGSGHEFGPAVSILVALTLDESRHNGSAKALPEPGGMSWAEYSTQRWGRVVPPLEAALAVEEGKLE
jgi:hypothetical protein